MTTKENEISWQVLAAQDINQEQKPHLRISSAGRCPRMQAYSVMGEEETNRSDRQGENRMAMGHMAEILIVQEMERNGWETRYTTLSEQGQLELEVEIPGTGRTIRGHPDGVCMHPEFTRGLWVTLECKSMSPNKAIEVERRGIGEVYPSYIAQIALYTRKLNEMKLVSHPERGAFGMMDREGRVLPIQWARWTKADVDQILETLSDIIRKTGQGNLPPRPYEQSSTDCRYCRYHNLCWETPPPPEPHEERRGPVHPTQEEVLEAAKRWAENKPIVDRARDMFQAVCNANGEADVIAEGVIGGYFQPRSERVYDPDALERAIPAEVLERCRSSVNEKPKAFWMRTERK